MKILLNDVHTYRVDTVEEVEQLHQELKENPAFTLVSFSYKTKYIKLKGEVIDELVYSEDSLISVGADDSGNTTVCYEEFGGSKTGIARFSASGKKTCSIVIDGLPDYVAAHAGRIAVASGNKITVYSSNGTQSKTIETESTVARIFICSGTVYTVEGGSIHKY